MATASDKVPRQRVPASERRDALIEAAVHEFAQGGLHGTPVDRIARSVGVAQPYVFSLFGSKRELFLAAVDRCFDKVKALLAERAESYTPAAGREELDLSGHPDQEASVLKWVGHAYMETLATDRDLLMLQLHAYAACDDDVIRDRVRENFAELAQCARQLDPNSDDESLDDFFRYGMWLNVAAATGIDNGSVSAWLRGDIDTRIC